MNRFNKIAFLVNPASAITTKNFNEALIQEFCNTYDICHQIFYSKSKEDLKKLTRFTIQEKFNLLIAVGGDGTVNSIASECINTNLTLAILPRGSGNGIATAIGYQKKLTKLLESIKTSHVEELDIGLVNERPFFLNFGLGFPARVINKYSMRKRHGLLTYLIETLSSLYHKSSDTYSLSDDRKLFKSVLVSNVRFMGYKTGITPAALYNDNKLHAVFGASIYDVALKFIKANFFNANSAIAVSQLEIIPNQNYGYAQLDGEFIPFSEKFKISLSDKKIKILKPL